MAKFWIDYSESVLIEAKTKGEAEDKFWDRVIREGDYSCTEGVGDTIITSIEEEEN